MFVIVPFLKVRFKDHSASEILYAGPWEKQLRLIKRADKRVIIKDLVFISMDFRLMFKGKENTFEIIIYSIR